MKRTILMALVLVLAGCQRQARATLAETYFPLNVGNSWTYTNGTEELTFTIIGTEEIDGHTYYKFNDYFNIGPPPPDGEWSVTRGRETLFRYDLAEDRIIMRIGPHDYDYEITRYDFTGNEWNPSTGIGWCQLTQIGITCKVPAGEFSNCIKFGVGESYDYPDTYIQGEYLALNVGNVKFVRPGSDYYGLIEGQWVTFELQSYTIIPEPVTILLLGLGGLLLRKRR